MGCSKKTKVDRKGREIRRPEKYCTTDTDDDRGQKKILTKSSNDSLKRRIEQMAESVAGSSTSRTKEPRQTKLSTANGAKAASKPVVNRKELLQRSSKDPMVAPQSKKVSLHQQYNQQRPSTSSKNHSHTFDESFSPATLVQGTCSREANFEYRDGTNTSRTNHQDNAMNGLNNVQFTSIEHPNATVPINVQSSLKNMTRLSTSRTTGSKENHDYLVSSVVESVALDDVTGQNTVFEIPYQVDRTDLYSFPNGIIPQEVVWDSSLGSGSREIRLDEPYGRIEIQKNTPNMRCTSIHDPISENTIFISGKSLDLHSKAKSNDNNRQRNDNNENLSSSDTQSTNFRWSSLRTEMIQICNDQMEKTRTELKNQLTEHLQYFDRQLLQKIAQMERNLKYAYNLN